MTTAQPAGSNRCMPLAEWPDPDRAAWTTALLPGGEPDQASVAAHWSEATRRMVRTGYGRWLTGLAELGMLDATTLPAERITPEHLSIYIAALRASVGEFTVAARVEQLGNALRAMAPDQHWHWLQHAADQIRAAAKAQRQASWTASLEYVPEPGAADGSAVSNRCMPLAEWPAADQAAWATALQPGDVLDRGGIAADWAAATRAIVINGYGRWLAWQVGRGDFDPLLPPSARITRPRLRAYTEALRASVAPFTVATRIEQLGNAMRAMAPEANWRWLQRAADRLRAGAVPVRDKRARMQSPERLLALGLQLMAEADSAVETRPIARAKGYRDGLLIALLALRPIRGRNLAAIACGQHLVRRGQDWWLSFDAAETKTHRALELTFPPGLVAQLERYLAAYRPVLLARGRYRSQPPIGLWISSQGTQMGYAAISHQVRLRTGAEFGRAISPHLFRDCAATEIATSDPEHARDIALILGHATLATSEHHYNQAQALEAGRRYHATIEAIRRSACVPSTTPA